jgi:hypothetical protein
LVLREEYNVRNDGTHPEEEETRKRVLNVILNHPEERRYGANILTGCNIINIEVSQVPKPHAVAIDYGGQVFAMGSGLTGMETQIPYDDAKGPRRGGMLKLRSIGGQVYGVGGRRSVCRREGINDWQPMWDKSLPLPKYKDAEGRGRFGFSDIDGFSQSDLYAVGGEGDVWNFDGKRWKRLPFPSNAALHGVCCGGDGQVYIGGDGGIFRGRHDKWTKLTDGVSPLQLTDMVWHDGKVWCTNDYGIWTIADGRIESFDPPTGIVSCPGYASAGDGVLVIAGMNGAMMHDGSQWQMLVNMGELYDKYGR